MPSGTLGGDSANQPFATPTALRDETFDPNERKPTFRKRKPAQPL